MGPLYIVHEEFASTYGTYHGHIVLNTQHQLLFHDWFTFLYPTSSAVTHLSLSEGKSSLQTSRSRRCWVRWGKMLWLMDIRTLYHRFEYVCVCMCAHSLASSKLFITSSSQKKADWLRLRSPALLSSSPLTSFASRSLESIILLSYPLPLSLCTCLSLPLCIILLPWAEKPPPPPSQC